LNKDGDEDAMMRMTTQRRTRMMALEMTKRMTKRRTRRRIWKLDFVPLHRELLGSPPF
jgi:hypothetical protein